MHVLLVQQLVNSISNHVTPCQLSLLSAQRHRNRNRKWSDLRICFRDAGSALCDQPFSRKKSHYVTQLGKQQGSRQHMAKKQCALQPLWFERMGCRWVLVPPRTPCLKKTDLSRSSNDVVSSLEGFNWNSWTKIAAQVMSL